MSPRLKLLLPAAVLVAGVLGGFTLLATGPRLEVAKPEPLPRLVRVVEVSPQEVQLHVRTHGTVAPRTESDLVPEVSGRVVWVSPSLVSGGFFEAGEPLLRLDPRDTQVALERARAGLARAESEDTRAEKELERRRGLRQRDYVSAAQLDDVENARRVAAATLREARAVLDQAERDLVRTEIRAPYAGRVREEHVDVGQFVTRGSPIARLYATDFAEIRLPVPDDQLAFLDLPLWRNEGTGDPGAEPRVILRARFAGAEHEWRGQVVRTEGEIDPRSRMVHVVARVEDPYHRAAPDPRPPLAVGLFVSADILGKRVEGAAILPRAAMRSRDQVLVVDSGDRLRHRTVEVLRIDRDRVVIRSGLEPGERVCISPLETVVDGMKVRPVLFEPDDEAHT